MKLKSVMGDSYIYKIDTLYTLTKYPEILYNKDIILSLLNSNDPSNIKLAYYIVKNLMKDKN